MSLAMGMRPVLLIFACLFSQAIIGQTEEPAIAIEKAPWHLPVFRNQYVTVLKIEVPPHRNTGFHIHKTDSVSVNIEDADMVSQLPGEKPAAPQHSKRGQASFVAYSQGPPKIHKATNRGETLFHNVDFLFNDPRPGGFSPSTRLGVAGYTQIMDNERVRGWRLVLEPGQTTGVFTQTAPGIRIVVDGGEIAELVPGQPDRGMNLKLGEFYWQDPGVMRAVRNIGKTRVEFVEFELK